MMLKPKLLEINAERVAEKLKKLISRIVGSTGVSGVVLGVSGGLDSSTTAFLLAQALGGEKVYAVSLPEENVSNPEDVEDAKLLAEKLGLKFFKIDISGLTGKFFDLIPIFNENALLANGNIKARVRMCILYYFANRFNLLVAGTGNRSEILTGYFTKYGDGASDFLPLGALYKTQVKQLAAYLGVPEKIIAKTPTAGLWIKQTDEEELGVKYEVLDLILHGLVDLGLTISQVAGELSIPKSMVERVKNMVEASQHKRKPPTIISPF
jgi:NAD+ synthase